MIINWFHILFMLLFISVLREIQNHASHVILIQFSKSQRLQISLFKGYLYMLSKLQNTKFLILKTRSGFSRYPLKQTIVIYFIISFRFANFLCDYFTSDCLHIADWFQDSENYGIIWNSILNNSKLPVRTSNL